MWYHRMLLVETYPPIPRLPSHDVWFARYRRNSAGRLEPTAIAIAFRSCSRYGSLYSLNVIPLDWSRRDKGFGSARNGVRAADRELDGENPRVGWAVHQASVDANRDISCLHSVCSIPSLYKHLRVLIIKVCGIVTIGTTVSFP